MRIVVLVDGEHYPPVVRAALARLRAEGHEVVGAVFLGGKEKLADGDLQAAYGVAVEAGGDREAVLGRLCAARRPEAVVDLSDEPVVGPAERFRLACVALRHGARYLGPDFELRPPRFARLLTKPAVRVFATGKRTGKTAVAGALARHTVRRGREEPFDFPGAFGKADMSEMRGTTGLRGLDSGWAGRPTWPPWGRVGCGLLQDTWRSSCSCRQGPFRSS